MVGGKAEDGSLSLQEKVIREQLQILDTLHGEIKRRSSHMIDINAKFGFLTMMELLMDSNKDEDIDSAIELLTATYVDIPAENLVRRVRRHIISFETQIGERVEHWNSLDFLQWLVK